jgi:type IV pilus assembly protein PilM
MALFGRKKKTTVGLDVGSGLIKVAVVSHASDEPELVRAAMQPLPSDAIVEGEVMDPSVVADAISACLEDAGVTGTEVITAVGGRDVIIKKILVERVKESQARELMRWEAEQHVPFDMESVELDFQLLDPEGTGPEMGVLLVAAKRELVESKLRLLADAGLTAALVDVDAFALHNAFRRNHPEAMDGTVALVNIGHEVTNVNVVEDGVPILTRDLPTGTRRLKEDLQRERGVSAEDADAMLRHRHRSEELDAVLETRGEEIAVGIERAVAFLTSSTRATGLRAVYLCGGGSCAPGLSATLGRRLRLAIEPANPLANLRVRPGAFESLVTEDIAPLFMLAIGLGLRSAR